jgi:hypothetical protein
MDVLTVVPARHRQRGFVPIPAVRQPPDLDRANAVFIHTEEGGILAGPFQRGGCA